MKKSYAGFSIKKLSKRAIIYCRRAAFAGTSYLLRPGLCGITSIVMVKNIPIILTRKVSLFAII
jgi:hypothetical protein